MLTPDGASARSVMLRLDAAARAGEATDTAGLSATDTAAAADRLAGLMLRLAVPNASIAENQKLGAEATVEGAAASHQGVTLQAEQLHLQAADMLARNEAARLQDAYARATLARGFWSGERHWQADPSDAVGLR